MGSRNKAVGLFLGQPETLDPGSSGTITVQKSPSVCNLVTAGAENRTLAAPTRQSAEITLFAKTIVTSCTITVTNGYDPTGNTTIVFTASGQNATLRSTYDGTTYKWKLLSHSATTKAAVGYTTGQGSTVTQVTDRATAVEINALCGAITTDSTSLAAEASAVFVVTNNKVAIGDVIVLSMRSGSVALNTTCVVSAVAAGSFSITVINNNVAAGTAETGAIIINFAVIKAVSA